MRLTYCSFATDERCLGVVVFDRELDPIMAAREAHRLGINPGGEVAVWDLSTDQIPKGFDS